MFGLPGTGRFLLKVFAAIAVLSTPLEQRESEIVALFLKYHPLATADEIAMETKIEKVEVYYCLNVLLERGIIKVIDSRPQRWVLK